MAIAKVTGDSEDDAAEAAHPAMQFRLDRQSGVPTYRQLIQQVEQALRLGYIGPGDQLPKVKDVVRSLAINPNTVMKAYRDLESRGLISSRPGVGTFVEVTLPNPGLPQQAELRKQLLAWLRAAHYAGLDRLRIDALLAITRREFEQSLDQSSAGRHPDRVSVRATA
jgi:GntR family transcriptional regulator